VSQTDGGPREHRYSPDGRWWWDGRTWQPVQGAPSRGPGSGSRWLLAALIVLVLALTVPLGVTAVLVASRIGHVPQPPGPPPSMPYLADASETGIELAATSHGLRCESPPMVGFGRRPAIRACHGAAASEVMSVQTIGDDAGHVSVVSANVVGLRPGDEAAALALLQAVVSATVAGPDGAADSTWLSAHFDQAGTSRTTVDGVTLRLMVSGPQRTLIVEPASAPS
jgi:hypothetical protein